MSKNCQDLGIRNWEFGIWNWELGPVAATVSRYDPADAVSTRQPVVFDRVRFPSDSDLSEAYRGTHAPQHVNSSKTTRNQLFGRLNNLANSVLEPIPTPDSRIGVNLRS